MQMLNRMGNPLIHRAVAQRVVAHAAWRKNYVGPLIAFVIHILIWIVHKWNLNLRAPLGHHEAVDAAPAHLAAARHGLVVVARHERRRVTEKLAGLRAINTQVPAQAPAAAMARRIRKARDVRYLRDVRMRIPSRLPAHVGLRQPPDVTPEALEAVASVERQ